MLHTIFGLTAARTNVGEESFFRCCDRSIVIQWNTIPAIQKTIRKAATVGHISTILHAVDFATLFA